MSFPAIYVRLEDKEILDFVKGIITYPYTYSLKKTTAKPPTTRTPFTIPPDAPRSQTLINAVKKGDYTIVKNLLISSRADVNSRGIGTNKTALMEAISQKHYEIAVLLLDKGADIDLRSNLGFTALHIACENGYLEFVRLLFAKRSPDVNVRTTGLRTPLAFAAFYGHATVVR